MIQDRRPTRVRGREVSKKRKEEMAGKDELRPGSRVCSAELALSNDAGQHESKEE